MSKKNDFTLVFTLRQHTPLIHFQAKQPGATLRATEFKPKLDRFLHKKDTTLPFREHPNGRVSLDYKVTIEPNRSPMQEIPKREKLFFANIKPKRISDEEWEKIKKCYKDADKTFYVAFFSFYPKILDAIEEHFEAFLAQTNFGTRQSKGFGSFYLSNRPFNPNLIDSPAVYRFSSSLKNYKSDIDLFYRFLRSGLNYPDRSGKTRFYMKSAMFAYAKKHGITWDKKAIKQYCFADQIGTQRNRHPGSEALNYEGENSYLMRDLLGLSTSQEWRSYHATITKSHPSIGRFRSPIRFKPIREKKGDAIRIYFWVADRIDPILSKTFTIQCNNHRGDLWLSTPQTFDLDDFLSFAFSIDLSQFVEAQYHQQNEYQRLEKILSDIQKSRSVS